MVRIFTLAFLASTSINNSFAADLDFKSSIDRVTVYPQGASVTRLTAGQVPAGDHVIILKDLPGNIQAESVRVLGKADGALKQNSVDIRQMAINEDAQPEERIRLERQIETLQDEMERINRTFSDNQIQRDMLQAIAAKALTPNSGNGALVVSGEGMTGLLESAAAKLDALAQGEMDMRGRQRAIGREISDLQNQINEMSSRNNVQTVVMINVSADATTNSEFSIEYKIEEAGWRPVYDASLKLGKGADDAGLQLERRALVTQYSPESWENVSLSLSTARPSSATAASNLNPFFLDQLPEVMPMASDQVRMAPTASGQLLSKRGVDKRRGFEAELAQEVAVPEVAVEMAGFQAIFQMPGKASIANNGESKTLTIDSYSLPVDLHVLSVPRIDPSAFLVAGFTFEGETPLLPGEVMLNRDGAFIGKGRLPLLNAGEKHELGFGVDDLVTVERVETAKEKGQSGFVSTVNTDERKYKTTVKNLHDFAIETRIIDRIPVSNHEDITVEMGSASTMPTDTNLEDQRGVLRWTNVIDGKGERVIDFGYRVSWPKDMKINSVQ